MWISTLSRQLGGLVLTALIGGLAGATLVRLAPGSGVDEREFDPRLSNASIEAVRNSRAADQNLPNFYWRYLGGLVHGELGESRSLRRPVTQLLRERGPITVRLATLGLAAGWTLGLSLAMAAALWRHVAFDLVSISLSSTFLCLPAAVVGLLILFCGAAPWWAIALTIFPKIFTYARNLLDSVYQAPHILLARAKGLPGVSILLRHAMPALAPEMFALAGVSVSLAFSAAIPLEAVCDLPGVGQLAWQAALGRDLPVLVTVTLLFTLVTRTANAAAGVATAVLRGEAS